MKTRFLSAALVAISIFLPRTAHTQIALSGTNYFQNFDSLGSGLPAGWTTRLGESTTSVGTSLAFTNTLASASINAWSNTTAAFKNFAATTGLVSSNNLTQQAASTNRALGIRPSASFGDVATNYAAFVLQITNTTGYENFSLTMDAMLAASETRTNVWTLDYGIGASPTSFTTLTNWTTPASFGATTLSISSATLAGIANISDNVWIRFGLLSVSTGTGSRDSVAIDNFSLSYSALAGTEYYWAADGANLGGAGTWNTSSNSWSASTSSVTGVAWDSSKRAIFTNGASTVTVDAVSANKGIQFSTTGYVLTNGTVTLGAADLAANSITTDGGVTAAVASVLAGSNGMTKSGAGTLVLSGANTFSGGVNISSGTLQISADSALGDAANDLAIGAVLKTTASVSLGAGRDISGSPTLDIAPGTTLAVNGAMGTTSTTLTNTGTLQLAGATKNVGALTFNAGALVDGMGGPVTASSVTAPGVANGALASIAGGLAFSSSGDKTVSVGAGGTLSISGPVSGTTGRIAKIGAGTLVLDGTNTTSGLRVGAAGASPVDGGVVVLGSGLSAGTNTLQLNYGTLMASAAISADVGLSVGGRVGAVPVLGGASDMVFAGTNSFFRGTGTSGELRLNVNNKTTLNGNWAATSGTGTATGITLGGSGQLVLNGSASALTETVKVADTLALVVNGALGGGVNVASGAKLAGTGTIAGPTAIAGTHAPGNSPGIQTFAGDLSYTAGSSILWELGVNAVGIRGTDYDGIDVGGALSFAGAPVTFAPTFNAVGSTVDWTDAFWASDHLGVNGWLVYSGAASVAGIENLSLTAQGTWLDSLSVALPGPATFFLEQQGNNVFLSYSSVPEPSTYALLALSAAGLAGHVIRRRRK